MEKKFHDMAITSAVNGGQVDVNGEAWYLHVLKQGNGANQREGGKVTVCNVNIHGVVYAASSATMAAGARSACRLMLVIDTQTNGAKMTTADILQQYLDQDGAILPGTQPDWKSFRNTFSGSRFVILKEKWYTFAPNNVIWGSAAIVGNGLDQHRISLSWKGAVPVHFSGSDGDFGSCRQNAFYLFAIGMGDPANQYHPILDVTARVKYYDN